MKPSPATSTWLRGAQAAVLANVSRWTISRWIATGVIPSNALLKCGRQHRVARSWILQHLGQTPEPPVADSMTEERSLAVLWGAHEELRRRVEALEAERAGRRQRR